MPDLGGPMAYRAHSSESLRDVRRRFNRRERVALFLASGGRCATCGGVLPASWHGDHVAPFSRGGETDVANGQALCPACNRKKGAGVIAERMLTTLFALRAWQKDAFGKWQVANKRDFLAVATPGAGKTTFALYVAAFLLEAAIVRRVVVVVPSDRLRKQWAAAAARYGIQLDDAFANRFGSHAADFDGVVVTYHAVGHEPTVHRAMCDASTLVIFDEIHHAGDHRAWGRGLRYAFEHAGRRLAVTGTPFRSDSARIPFVFYDGDGRCKWDAHYGYEEALRERVCRNVFFPSYEGNMQWWTSRGGERSARFGDELPTEEESRRLNAALAPAGDWLRQVLRDADARLRDVRAAHYEHAAGLVVCRDREHARAVARLLEGITGERPAVATSDDPDAARMIEAFADGRGDLTGDPYRGLPRWLVAVRMVSEGVDIPRLFVGVFATNIMTELHFRQVVGRFVRMMPDVEDQAGYLFIPKVDPLVAYVQRIKNERDHVIEQEAEPADEDDRGGGDGTRSASDFVVRGSEAEVDSVFIDGAELPPGLLGEARKFALAFGYEGWNDYMLAKIMRDMGEWQAFVDRGEMPMRKPIVVDVPRPSKLSADKSHAKRELKSFVNRLCSATGVTHERVYGALKRRQGTDQDHASLDQLIQRKEWVKGWIEIATQLDHALTEWEWDGVMVDGQPPR
jgi:superfamily II DNA or RNA helicase